jgi:hypothetical protein
VLWSLTQLLTVRFGTSEECAVQLDAAIVAYDVEEPFHLFLTHDRVDEALPDL